jgi:hypothetical protein
VSDWFPTVDYTGTNRRSGYRDGTTETGCPGGRIVTGRKVRVVDQAGSFR